MSVLSTYFRLAVVMPLTVAAILIAGRSTAVAQDERRDSARSAALETVEAHVRKTFTSVRHMSPEALAALLAASSDRIVLLDVRTAEEFAVSRLQGAIHVAPDAGNAAEIAAQAGGLKDKIVIAYCSVGVRSSRLLARLGQRLQDQGAAELHNLSGGAFRWRNEQRSLVAAGGQTRNIHPYNVVWRQLLVDPPVAKQAQER